jgi:DNA-directed RNA polymerase subunit RPC12/RpoP
MEYRRKQLTRAQRKEIYNKYNGHCAYCGCKILIKEKINYDQKSS